jgi:hypothetical protein
MTIGSEIELTIDSLTKEQKHHKYDISIWYIFIEEH